MSTICAPLPRASMTEAHSFSAASLAIFFMSRSKRYGVDGPSPARRRLHDGILAGDGDTELAREPFGNVLGRWIDTVERRHIINTAVVEHLRKRFEFVPRAHEIDGDGV